MTPALLAWPVSHVLRMRVMINVPRLSPDLTSAGPTMHPVAAAGTQWIEQQNPVGVKHCW